MLRRVIVGSLVAGSCWYAFYRTMRWRASWGAEAGESARTLPGDELIPDATTSDTRAITIDAPPEAVWPWLVQMGYGRAGWYSYDRLDMRGHSAEAILPELQQLAAGDIVPTDPGGGFVVRHLDPGRALVLGVDEEILARRRPSALATREAPGLAASGKLLETSMPPEFRASWAFVLEPMAGGRTRLIERFRGWFGPANPVNPVLGPALGFGVFLMMRRQLLGIRDRAERMTGAERTGAMPPPVAADDSDLPAEPIAAAAVEAG